MQDDVNRKLSAPVSSHIIMGAIAAAALFGGFIGYKIGTVSGSSGAWAQLSRLGSSAAEAAPQEEAYSRKVISDCRDGFSRDPSVDCEAVMASQPEPKTSHDMAIAAAQTIDSSCPPPTTRQGGTCVLTSDAVLTETLWLASDTTLDCQGHRLTPSVDGQTSVWGETRFGMPRQASVPSVPSTAVLLAGDTTGVTVKNCVIENFDFGVVIANSKIPPAAKTASRNLITGNTLNNRYRGVEVIASDRNEIVGNTIHSFAPAAGGISINHDSDDNVVKDNTYVGPNTEYWTPGPMFPGGKDESTSPWLGEAVIVQGPEFSYNFKVGKRLFVGTMDTKGRAERNLIEGNDVDVPFAFGNGLVTDSRTEGTIFRRNIVRRAADAIRLVGHTRAADGGSMNPLVEENTIVGPAEQGILAANTQNPVIRNNKITGAWLTGTAMFFQDNATFTGNLVQNSQFGLYLILTSSANVSFNDFVDNELGVDGWVETPVELSFEGQGNYWGHSEPPAFRATDTSDQSLFTDSYASLVPLSGLLDD